MTSSPVLRRARAAQAGDPVINRRKSCEWTYEARPCTPPAARAGWLRRLARLGGDYRQAATSTAAIWYQYN